MYNNMLKYIYILKNKGDLMAKKSFIKVSSCALATLLMFSNFINCSAQSKVKHDIKKENSRVGLKLDYLG